MPDEGAVPAGWSRSRLGDHFLRVNRRNAAGVRRVLTASGDRGLIDQEEFFSKRVAGADLSTYLHIKNGEFAYNRSAMAGYPVGAVKRLERYDEGVVSSLYLCFGLRADAPVDPDFAAHVLDSRVLEDELRPIVKVGARAHGLLNVSADDFMSVRFPTPPLPEQKKIAAILSSVDEAIQATQLVIDQTRRVKEGLLQDLLARGLPGHTRFKQTEIGEIPESWEVASLAEVSTRITDGTHQGVSTSNTGTYRFLYVTCVRPFEILMQNAAWIDSECFDTISRGRVPVRGAILYTAVGATLGYAAVVDTDEQFSFQRHIAIIYPQAERVRSGFLAAVLNSPAVVRRVWAVTVGNAQPSITLGELKTLRLPLPSLLEQDAVLEALDSLDATLALAVREAGVLSATKAGLLQDLLTGKVRVSS